MISKITKGSPGTFMLVGEVYYKNKLQEHGRITLSNRELILSNKKSSIYKNLDTLKIKDNVVTIGNWYTVLTETSLNKL